MSGLSDPVSGAGLEVFYVREPSTTAAHSTHMADCSTGVYFAYDTLGSMVSRWVGTGVEGNYYYKAFGELLNVEQRRSERGRPILLEWPFGVFL